MEIFPLRLMSEYAYILIHPPRQSHTKSVQERAALVKIVVRLFVEIINAGKYSLVNPV